jgi:chemotaxis protein MotB
VSGRKGKKHEHVNHERWLVSYADFITLLFAFFVVMFAVSQVDSAKLGRFVESANAAFRMRGVFPDSAGSPIARGGGGGSAVVPMVVSELPSFLQYTAASPLAREVRDSIEAKLRGAGRSNEARLRNDPRGVIVSLPARALFPAGSAELRGDAAAALRDVAAALEDEPGAIQIEAHTDDSRTPFDAYASNWDLSAARAARVARFLVEEADMAPERLSASGLAETRPLVENSNEAARELNRRVDLLVVTEGLAEEE